MRLGRLSLGHMSVAMVLTLSACGGSTEVSPPDYDNLSTTGAGVSTLPVPPGAQILIPMPSGCRPRQVQWTIPQEPCL